MEITIIIPISRPDFLKRLFAQLDAMDIDRAQTNLLTYVDGDQVLFEKARNLTVAANFREKLCSFRSKGQANPSSIHRRRQRIADIHNELKKFINKTGYVLLLEDDTLPPLNAVQKLKQAYLEHPYAGFITGVQLGRWGYNHIGAWRADDVYDTQRLTSIAPEQGITEVDAAGLYCCLIAIDRYLNHAFKPFEKILGPDVDFGLSLRKEGYKNYVINDLKCRHLTKTGEISVPDSEVIQIQFDRMKDHQFGWEQKILANIQL